MRRESLARELEDLPPAAQKEVLEFVAFLRERHKAPSRATRVKRRDLALEPFVGMWRDRKDMATSADWVRKVRRTHWAKKHD